MSILSGTSWFEFKGVGELITDISLLKQPNPNPEINKQWGFYGAFYIEMEHSPVMIPLGFIFQQHIEAIDNETREIKCGIYFNDLDFQRLAIYEKLK